LHAVVKGITLECFFTRKRVRVYFYSVLCSQDLAGDANAKVIKRAADVNEIILFSKDEGWVEEGEIRR